MHKEKELGKVVLSHPAYIQEAIDIREKIHLGIKLNGRKIDMRTI